MVCPSAFLYPSSPKAPLACVVPLPAAPAPGFPRPSVPAPDFLPPAQSNAPYFRRNCLPPWPMLRLLPPLHHMPVPLHPTPAPPHPVSSLLLRAPLLPVRLPQGRGRGGISPTRTLPVSGFSYSCRLIGQTGGNLFKRINMNCSCLAVRMIFRSGTAEGGTKSRSCTKIKYRRPYNKFL